MKNAFIDAQCLLTAWGNMDSNGTDTAVPVADDFSLQPGAWKWDGTQWVAYVSWASYQTRARALLDQSDVTMLRCIENAVTVPAEWAAFRKALRSIISAATGDATQPLPTRPAYPAGT